MNARPIHWTGASLAALALALGTLLLATPPLLSDSGGGSPGTAGDSGHGDNPVVGSLPVEQDDDLLDMFFRWTGTPAPGSGVFNHAATLALAGDSSIQSAILAASGTPYGRVSSWSNFQVFGLVHDGQFTVARADAQQREVVLAQWLPDEYLGGNVQVVSTVGSYSFTVQNHSVELGMDTVAKGPGIVESAVVTITPDPEEGGRVLIAYVDVVDTLVTVTYLP